MKKVKVVCRGAKLVELGQLVGTQGELKYLDEDNYDKFKKVVLSIGFSEPISVWQDGKVFHVLNGHQRLYLLNKMVDEGYKVGGIPVNTIEADNLKEAKKHILSLASQYGQFSEKGVFDFLNENQFDLEHLKDMYNFADFDLKGFEERYYVESKSIDDLLAGSDLNTLQKRMEKYQETQPRQVVIVFTKNEFDIFEKKAAKIIEQAKLSNYKELFIHLVGNYEKGI